ncbi:unnamed protein product [Phytophthora lilii]|uniref:Unnamed protein product n=1 Tax=Phytophthora lilii TaxID=2077276 RepID=A0A9W6XCN3_9STRA|nr:unnamed protein product [Phytophthora lilii]
MDPDKVKIITEWPLPKTKNQMESFLGTTVYVSRFCKDSAQLAGPLHECIKGKRSRDAIELDENQVRCFDELKKRLSSPPVLSLPNFSNLSVFEWTPQISQLGESYFKRRENWNIQ